MNVRYYFALVFFVVSFIPMCLRAQTLNGYSCDFEDAAENSLWTLNPIVSEQYRCTNEWHIGAGAENGGTMGLYISADGGTTAGYVNQGTSVIAYRALTLAAGDYELSFDWQAVGFEDEDGLYVCWMPESVATNSANDMSMSRWVSKYWLTIGGKNQLYNSLWTSAIDTIHSDGVTPYKLVFVWNNSIRDAVPPGACLDNINIIPLSSCERPNSIRATVDGTDVTVAWSGAADSYDIRGRLQGSETWVEASGLTAPTFTFNNLGEGVYDIYIRSNCDDYHSAWVSFKQFVYYPGTRCVDYLTLTDDNCWFGDTDDPKANAGVVDYGYTSKFSRHTIHYNTIELDSLTDYKLKTVPEGEIASVRLGNWNVDGEAETIEYDYDVNEGENSVLLLKYAVVLQNPNHDMTSQPRFKLEVLRTDGSSLDANACAEADFYAGYNTEGWHYPAGSSSGDEDANTPPIWKEWTDVGVSLRDYVGERLKIRLTTYDCTQHGHYGYAYFALSCSDGEIQNLSCGGDAENVFRAPDGFKYRWYPADDPTDIISYDQEIALSPMDTMTYYCDVINPNPGKENCYYRIVAYAVARFPVPEGAYEAEVVDCENVVTFSNTSHVIYKNPISGVVTPAPDMEVDSVTWDFGDGTPVVCDTTPVHVYPQEGGQFTVTMRAFLGNCDSITQFTIDLPSAGIEAHREEAFTCDVPYYFNGRPLWTSGEYADTLVSTSTGCDSVVILDLTVGEPKTYAYSDTICTDALPEYDFHGQEISGAGTYTATIGSSEGCDSTITLTLYVNESLNVYIEPVMEICADDESISIPYTITSGMVTAFDISFNNAEMNDSVGADSLCPDEENLQLVIPVEHGLRPGIYEAQLLLYNATCGNVPLTTKMTVNYPDTIIAQRWNDVLGVRNSGYNGGYEFAAFQWYKDGEPVSGATSSNLYEPDGLDASAQYSVLLTRADDGVSVFTCPVQPQRYDGVEDVPTVTFTETKGAVSVKSGAGGEIRLWSLSGVLLGTFGMTGDITEITVPAQGVYLLEIRLDNGMVRTEKVVVM